MQIITCPVCGNNASFIVTQGLSITSCTNCYQATVAETGVIIRIDKDKLKEFSGIPQEFFMIAMVAKALFENWDTISMVSPYS